MTKFAPLFLCLLSLTACRENSVETPDFDVTAFTTKNVASNTFNVNDTIVYKFAGNPDVITFYSGERGRNYEYRNRLTATNVAPKFSFTSLRANPAQANSLKLLVSTDFNGTYTAAGIAAATWTDITSRAALSTGTALASGSIDLSDFATAGKPVYVAYKFAATKSTTTAQPTWTITNSTLTNTALPENTTATLFDINSMGWTTIDVKNPANVWALATNQLQVVGGAANSDENEDWAVSRQIDLKVVKPDLGVGLKNLSTLLPSYTYRVTEAGSYTVTFVGANDRAIGTRKEVARKLVITVTP